MSQTEQIMQTARGLRARWLSTTPHARQAIHGTAPTLAALLDELARRLDPARRRGSASGDKIGLGRTPGGAALDSAVDALLNQADLTGDSDLPAVAEWLRQVSARDDDE